MSGDLRDLVRAAAGGAAGGRPRNLSRVEAEAAFSRLLAGEGDEIQVAALLVALRARGLSGDELAGFAAAARPRIAFPALPEGAVVIATSRLGKRQRPLSFLAAVAAAVAAGVQVLVQAAPHAEGAGVTLGDLWVRLGGELHGDAARVADCLRRHGLGFWQPTQADPGWKRLLEIENRIGLRLAPDQVCKLLAPPGCRLMVPARGGPVLGLASEAVASLGHQRALIVQGVEGSLDPFVAEPTRGVSSEHGLRSPLRLDPADLVLDCPGEPEAEEEDLLEASLLVTRRALLGGDDPASCSALIGAGLIVRLSGRFPDLAEAVGAAREAIDSGAAQQVLEGMVGC
ncbi:MAG: hypothetical protein D6702_11525 [Planctomycetota bacterium]|nr:MAG: hypothetical protein D6702_11525 [Planctomycetota bacterium]